MPNNLSFEQTSAMRQAIDIVLPHLGGCEDGELRAEIAKVVLNIAVSQRDYDADTLASLAIEKLGEPARKAG